MSSDVKIKTYNLYGTTITLVERGVFLDHLVFLLALKKQLSMHLQCRRWQFSIVIIIPLQKLIATGMLLSSWNFTSTLQTLLTSK